MFKVMYQIFKKFLIVIIISAIPCFYQCSLVGLITGTAIDHSNPRTITIHKNALDTIDPQTSIEIVFFDKNPVEGVFLGLEKVSEQEYAGDYEKKRGRLVTSFELPKLGDTLTVTIKEKTGREVSCILSGFDYHTVRLNPVKTAYQEDLDYYKIGKIINNKGEIIELETLLILIDKGKIPVMTQIKFMNSSGETSYSLENIDKIFIHKIDFDMTPKLLAAGLAIDLTVFFIVRAGLGSLD